MGISPLISSHFSPISASFFAVSLPLVVHTISIIVLQFLPIPPVPPIPSHFPAFPPKFPPFPPSHSVPSPFPPISPHVPPCFSIFLQSPPFSPPPSSIFQHFTPFSFISPQVPPFSYCKWRDTSTRASTSTSTSTNPISPQSPSNCHHSPPFSIIPPFLPSPPRHNGVNGGTNGPLRAMLRQWDGKAEGHTDGCPHPSVCTGSGQPGERQRPTRATPPRPKLAAEFGRFRRFVGFLNSADLFCRFVGFL